MLSEETGIAGLVLVTRPTHQDERGSFSRLYSTEDLESLDLSMECLQVNHSISHLRGTLRGLHFQYPPFAERKLVACAAGEIWDVVVDLRPGSTTFLQSCHTVLTGNDGRSLLVPEGFAHGFITLAPSTHVIYVSSQVHAPEFEDGLRYDDAMIDLPWPEAPAVVSEKDLRWAPLRHRVEFIARQFNG